MDALIVFGAQDLIFGVAAGAIALIAYDKTLRVRLGLVLVVALPIAYALARLVGHFYSHPQPFAVEGFLPLIPHEVDNSFPSDHTLIAGVFASVAYLANKRFGLELWAITLLIGLSRMLAGLHWGTDVLAAVVLALVVVFCVDYVFKLISKE